MISGSVCALFFCTVTSTTELYAYSHTLSLPDALPFPRSGQGSPPASVPPVPAIGSRPTIRACRLKHESPHPVAAIVGRHILRPLARQDRKSKRLNSSH